MRNLSVLAIDQFRIDQPSNAFYANSFAEHLAKHSDKISTPHKHDFYLVVIITRGVGVHEVDFRSYDVKAGSVFMLGPGATHNWELSQDIEGYIFFHTREFFDVKFGGRKVDDFPFYFSVQNSPVVYLGKKECIELVYYFKAIFKEYSDKNLMKWQKIAALVDLVYIQISRTYAGEAWIESKANMGYALKMRELEVMINQHFLVEKSPSVYAGKMNMSSKHLNRIIKSLVNKTVTDIIADRVLLEAKRMLIHSDIRIAELADKLGYEDCSYFSRLFKRRCGLSPKEFREGYNRG